MRLISRLTPQRIANLAVIVTVIAVTITQLDPSQLLSGTMDTGGDTAAHVVTAWYLMHHLGSFSLTSWDPNWYDGFPLYTYYFVLPDLFAAIGGHFISFAVAFKLATILGSVLMPVCAYTMGRLFRAPDPVPAALAAATLPFLFDGNWTIDGGNIFSTLAGEYSFSLSLAFALVTIGLFARGIRTGKGRWLTAFMLALTLAAHLLPWLWVIGMALFLLVYELSGVFDASRGVVSNQHWRKCIWWTATALAGGAALSAWWLVPFVTSQEYTTVMGYTNVPTNTLSATLDQLGWVAGPGSSGGDRIVIILALVALVVALRLKDRLGVTLTMSAVFSMIAFIWDPQSAIFNQRIVPFWYLSIWLSVGWLVAVALRALIDVVRAQLKLRADADAQERLEYDAELARTTAYTRVLITFVVIIAAVATVLPRIINPALNTNEVTNWAAWNYSGYQAKPEWNEFHDVYTTLDRLAKRYGCGRAMWEYNANENGWFGSPMALMSLPMWTNGCINSMEGLLFESSATTPYHFLDQAELSLDPSDPEVGLDYGSLDVKLGVEHLQLLGTKYYFAYTPDAVREANADPSLKLLAITKTYPAPGVQWHIYLVRHASLVVPLHTLPNVVADINSRVKWLNANQQWWLNPKEWDVLYAADGPSTWPLLAHADTEDRVTTPTTKVTDIVVDDQSISFHVTRLHTPVLVKISYYPRWQAVGATGPYRVSPDLMVVVPTSHHVVLTYGADPAVRLGDDVSIVAWAVLLAVVWRSRFWRRPRRVSSTRAH